jgi:hypothetical protein
MPPQVFSIGPVANQPGSGGFRSSQVELRVGNASGASPLASTIVVSAYDSSGADAAVGGAPATLYFTTTFQIDEANGVVKLTIPTTVASFLIRVSASNSPSGIEIDAQGIDAFGNFVPEHSFPFGDWRDTTTPSG